METKGPIGIVGGMGPEAGIDLARLITEQTIAGCDQDHIPQVLFSLPEQINDRTEYLLKKSGPNPADSIARILITMESVGVKIAGLACNTAHAPEIFNIETLYLPEPKQNELHQTIYDPHHGIKANANTIPDKTRLTLMNSFETITEMGANAVLLACTELSIAYHSSYFKNIPVLNSSLILARALINAHSPGKLYRPD
ncbi:MAG: hypothetical protein K9G70_03605 [Prolixibacteraceae bacterium]|nr:hypothetical protein [Prolixibacteraceae bacterium]